MEDVEPDGDVGPEDAGDLDSEEQLLAADEGEDPRRARSVCCERSLSHVGVQVQHTVLRRAHELTRRYSTGAAPPARGGAAESEPLVLRRREAKRVNDLVETIEHPFGCGRRDKESSSLLLLSSS